MTKTKYRYEIVTRINGLFTRQLNHISTEQPLRLLSIQREYERVTYVVFFSNKKHKIILHTNDDFIDLKIKELSLITERYTLTQVDTLLIQLTNAKEELTLLDKQTLTGHNCNKSYVQTQREFLITLINELKQQISELKGDSKNEQTNEK